MKITFSTADLPKNGTAIIAVTNTLKLGPLATKLNKLTDGLITKAMKLSKFSGDKGEFIPLISPSGTNLDLLLICGIGKDTGRSAFI